MAGYNKPINKFIYLAKKTSRGPAGLVIGITILFFYLQKIGVNNIINNFSHVRLNLILIMIILLMLWIAAGALNIKIMLTKLIKEEYIHIFHIYCKANTISLIIPGQVGDAVIINFFRKYSIPISQGATIFGIDKIITLFWYTIFSIYGMLLINVDIIYINKAKENAPLTIALIIVISITIIITIYTLYSNVPERIQNWLTLARNYIKISKQEILIDWGITLIRTLLLGGAYWLAIKSFSPSQSPSFIQALCLSIMGGMVAYIPISFNGLGTVEAAHIFLFNKIGIEAGPILSAILSLRVIMIIVLILGLFLSDLFVKATGRRVEDNTTL